MPINPDQLNEQLSLRWCNRKTTAFWTAVWRYMAQVGEFIHVAFLTLLQ